MPWVLVHCMVRHAQVESILNPVRGVRDAQIRAGITPTNHARHNALAVKEQSRLNALYKQQEVQEAAEAAQALREGRPPPSKRPGGASAASSR